MRIGSLFSGSGMLDEGVRAVFGGDVAWHAEVDPAACKVLAHRYPGVPNLGDISTVKWTPDCPECGKPMTVGDYRDGWWCYPCDRAVTADYAADAWPHIPHPVDVITGGSPCQDVSHAGKRAGMRVGTRSGLWARMCDAIESIRPSLVVWENVRGVLSAEADSALEPCPGCVGDGDDGAVLRALGRVLGDLAELGYDAQWHGLRAADVGGPHGRFRVFVVAEHTHGRGRGPAGLTGVGSAVGCGGVDTGDSAAASDSSPDAVAAADTDNTGSQGRQSAGGRDLPARGAAPDADRDALRQQPVTEPGRGSAAFAGLPGATTPDTHGDGLQSVGRLKSVGRHADRRGSADVAWGQYEPAIRRWETVLGRPAPAPTEPGPRGGQRLSPRLTEWMMGWPDGWVTDVPGVTRNDALKICGNGVVPQQAAEALRRMLPHLAERAA